VRKVDKSIFRLGKHVAARRKVVVLSALDRVDLSTLGGVSSCHGTVLAAGGKDPSRKRSGLAWRLPTRKGVPVSSLRKVRQPHGQKIMEKRGKTIQIIARFGNINNRILKVEETAEDKYQGSAKGIDFVIMNQLQQRKAEKAAKKN